VRYGKHVNLTARAQQNVLPATAQKKRRREPDKRLRQRNSTEKLCKPNVKRKIDRASSTKHFSLPSLNKKTTKAQQEAPKAQLQPKKSTQARRKTN
jgi:hypothetical protein